MIRLIFLLFVVMHSLSSNAATYVFEGLSFNFASGPNYSEGMRISGFIEFADELIPNSTVNTAGIINYRFNDGVQTLDQSNSEISINTFNTDRNGLPFLYRFNFTKTPVTNVVGEPFSGIQLIFTFNTEGFERFEYGFTSPCIEVSGSVCDVTIFERNVDTGGFFNPGLGGAFPGSWSLQGAGGATQSVPINGVWALALMVLLILMVTLLNRKNHCNKA